MLRISAPACVRTAAWALVLAVALIGVQTSQALAANYTIPQAVCDTGNCTTDTKTVSVGTTVSGSVSLNLTVSGKLRSDDVVRVYFDNVLVASVGASTNNVCGTTSVSATIPSATVSPLITDGSIDVKFVGDHNASSCSPKALMISGTLSYSPSLTTTTTTLSASPTSSTFNQSVTFTATVSPTVPNGETVTFKDGGSQIGTGVTSGGVATLTTSSLAVGSHAITADYPGDASYAASTSSSLTFAVSAPSISISPPTLTSGTGGAAYSATLTASGGTAPYSFAVTGGVLPPGLSLSSAGALTGTPSADGSFDFSVTVTDSNGFTGSVSFSLAIGAPTIALAPASLPDGDTYVAYSEAVSASGGSGPYTYAISSGALPTGLSLSSAGALTGTPTVSGPFSFSVTATDSNGFTGSASFSVAIGAPTIALAPGSLPDGDTYVAYSEAVSASGGSGPYTYAISSGALPTGLALSSTGALTGTPTVSGPFSFSVTATDSNGFTGSASFSLAIGAPTIALAPASLPDGDLNVPYSQAVSASGGSGPYTYAISSGALPSGLALNPATGALTGTPSAGGSFSFSVAATDSNGFAGSASFSLAIGVPTIAITPASLPGGDVQVAYSQLLSASGGSAPYTYAIAFGALPTGLTLNSATGALTGTPTIQGSFTFSVKATDSFGSSGTQSYTVAIGTTMVQGRTRQIISNYISQRGNSLTSNEPASTHGHQRFSGSVFGGPSGESVAAAPAQLGGPPVAFAMTPDGNGGFGRMAFATSFRQMLAAKTPQAPAAGTKGDGMMALGANTVEGQASPVGAPFDVWVEGIATRFDNDKSGESGNIGIVYVGAEYEVMPGVLIGALMQFDRSQQITDAGGGEADGHGWMTGPYLSAKISENLYFDARAAWGRSDNSISPLGTYTDKVDGERRLARADLTGNWRIGALSFSPTVGVAYFKEDIDAYFDSNGIFIGGQTFELGRLNFGPDFGYTMRLADGSILEPTFSVQGIWDFNSTHAVTFNELPGGTPELRAKLQSGITLTAPWGYAIRGVGFYDGVGSGDYRAYGGQLMVSMPFN